MRLRFLVPSTLAFTLAILTACGDHVTDPDAAIDSAEAEAVMRSAEALPLLPGFLDAADPADGRARATLVRARELWDAGTATEDPRADARRRLAVGYALPVLVESVPADEWVVARARLEEWTATAGAMLRHIALPEVQARVEAAGRQLRYADGAPSDRRRIHHLLLASSELVETTPRFVARSTTRDAAVAISAARARADTDLPPEDLERAGRLMDWAARAIEEGEYLLAIQRAYYAMQLVEER